MKQLDLDTIKNKEFTGDAGAGMVKVTIKGPLITKVDIDKTMFANNMSETLDDLDFIADLFKAAVNQALNKSTQDLADIILKDSSFLNGI